MGFPPCGKCQGRGFLTSVIETESNPALIKTKICPLCKNNPEAHQAYLQSEERNRFLQSILSDRLNGMGWRSLAKKYDMNVSNCRRLVLELESVADMLFRE